MSYWWCLNHQRVEGDEGCAHDVRLGPYETESQAEAAIQKAHERTLEWDEQDRRYSAGPHE